MYVLNYPFKMGNVCVSVFCQTRAAGQTMERRVSPQGGLTWFQKSSIPSFAISSRNDSGDLNLNTLLCDAKNGTTAKSTLSAFVREHQLELAEPVRIYRNETSQDSRPNKALDSNRLKVLLEWYPHLSVRLDIARQGISRVWHNSNRQTSCPLNNHLSFTRHEAAALRSIITGQASGHFLVVDASIMDMWPNVHCSPFGAEEKSDVDLRLEVRPIHDLSFPNVSSTNDLLDKACLPEVNYAYVTVLAARKEDLASPYPQFSIKVLKGDVKGAYRHLMTNANHFHQMAGLTGSLDTLIIDLAAPFGWADSPQYYGAFGRAISWQVSTNSPSTVSDSDDNTPCFGYEWVNDYVMIRIDSQDRLLLVESTLRHAMLAVLGSRSINETKFTSWKTRLTVLGLTWDTVHRSLSIPQAKIDKRSDTRNDLQKVLGSLRYITNASEPPNHFTSLFILQRWFLHILRHDHLSELPLCMFGALPDHDFHVDMDASDVGLTVLNPTYDEFIQIRFYNDELDLIRKNAFSINVREHLCIALTVWTWGQQWSRQKSSLVPHIHCRSDNSTVVSWSNKLASSCPEAQEINRAIGLGEAGFNIRISAAHLPGSTNCMADAASQAWSESHASVWTNFSVHWTQVRISRAWRKIYKTFSTNFNPTHRPRRQSPNIPAHGNNGQNGAYSCSIRPGYPTAAPQLALFVVFCWKYGFGRPNQGNSALTILSKISQLSWHHQLKLGFSVGLSPGHKLALLEMRRHDRPSSKKHPVTIRIMRTLHSRLYINQIQGRFIWGAAVLSFFYLLRRSEYLARGQKSQTYAFSSAGVVILINFDKSCSTLV
ncbi:hypothetical protein PHMEG_0008226 [Phytophthora megakarya]|uniref:Reverse transcriptase n=1 Tax=Phytophthora megakarya TaxID=4795 RepID=A0A225WL01_9STRA|nr:hypothetical protein PHMEG_0008226 [Phytophthora megakarya]